MFFTHSYSLHLNTAHFLMEIPNKPKFQQIGITFSFNFNFDYFKRLYINFTVKRYSFLVINITLPSNNALYFRKNIVWSIKSNLDHQC